ncbi:MAG: alpha/beta fold hydrolase [Candidatus Hydrogenedentes bacterium]|nr:alpha/beta fold hydrolase [Candidatus Hydrogenedentota bacterium]
METFVLIHGSWHGGWCWHKVVPRIEAAGHRVLAPDMPAHGKDWRKPGGVTLDNYVARVGEALDTITGPAVLVAHSRGGIVASQAAERYPDRIGALVYLAAFLLPDGARVMEYGGSDKDSMIVPNLVVNPEEGWDMLKREAFRPALYADCCDDDVALCEMLLTPEPLQPTLTPLRLTAERYGTVPRYYIELLQDRAVSVTLQRRMHTAMPCKRVVSIDAGHSAYFSKPDILTEHLLAVASELREVRDEFAPIVAACD